MKNRAVYLVSMGLALALAAPLLEAQSIVTVNVPFSFTISNKTLPAGHYSVSSSRDRLLVQDPSAKTVFIGIVNAVSGRRVGETGQVTFHCYNERCFLSELWTPADTSGKQLTPSRQEKELAAKGNATDFALLGQPSKR